MKTLHLEDQGQDFLEFDINDENIIINTRPFQGWVWDGRKILNPKTVEAGDFLTLSKKDQHDKSDFLELKYPVERVEKS